MTDARDRDGATPAETAREAVRAGIAAARPETVLGEAVDVTDGRLRVADETYDLDDYEELFVLGGGNAAGRAASHLAESLGEALDGGIVVTDDPAPAGPIDVVAGTHPVPDEANVAGARRILDAAADADEDTLVLAPITGGGSALLAAPVDGVSLAELRALTEALVRSGAPIDRINAVRKHVSEVKGGRLARALAPATTVGLVFSDVTSGDPSVVASGPLSPDQTTYADALATLSEFGVDAPDAVLAHLRAGAAGEIDETPGADDPAFDHASVHVLADNFTALAAARDACRKAGYGTLVLSSSVRGEAREAAKTHAAIAEEVRRTGNPAEPPLAVLSGGEATVTVRGDGRGGPNQEFALAAAIEFAAGDAGEAVLCAVDTDGIDGPTDAAGALVSRETVDDVRRARSLLADNDVAEYLDERDALVRTGPTGTNVNDLRVLLLPE
ncbi:glycerate kinase type-2 family protein [Halobellus rubicundus]|uniref:Glycerate kinase n=1 Tax=Halobellus rubicundus TaxID=2996466 RepID=A0ABD5MCF7_9EURY